VGATFALDATGAEQIFPAAHVRLTHERAAAVTETDRGVAGRPLPCRVIARDSHSDALTVSGDGSLRRNSRNSFGVPIRFGAKA
jgi:hypothetical protein